MRRVTSTPEIRRLHESSLSRNFPMQISEISNLETHHEHEHEYDDEEEGVHGVDECEDHKEGNSSCAVENTPTEHTVEEDPDDFGFFNIDDEDEDYNNTDNSNDSVQFQEGSSDYEQAEKKEKNRQKELREQEQVALLEDKNLSLIHI